MAAEKKTHRKPAIIVTHSDHERLSRLAEAHAARNPEVSERCSTSARIGSSFSSKCAKSQSPSVRFLLE